ncbi:hypothetical protein GGR55DRAFT_679415 [Xylaria sp. FL0064]|nr:hypothetical protein GGR55DRAFT_679415 [Xylaria sp. FL0064]
MYFSKITSVLLATPIMTAIVAPVLKGARKADDAVPGVWGSAITAPAEDNAKRDTNKVVPDVWGTVITAEAAKDNNNKEVTPGVWGSAITAPSEES